MPRVCLHTHTHIPTDAHTQDGRSPLFTQEWVEVIVLVMRRVSFHMRSEKESSDDAVGIQ